MTHARALHWYRLTYVACIVALSVQTALGARNFADHHFWLAAIEIGAALLMLARRSQVAGLVLLLAVYAVAAAVTLHLGKSPAHLVLYAASAMLIVRLDPAGAPDIPERGASQGLRWVS
jgi:hypothetical protein